VRYVLPAPPPPPAFIHVDLDGLWTLADCYGYDEGESFTRDPVFERALPRMLDLFDRHGVKATFFLIGRDLEHPAKRDAVGEILRRGHDTANHTYHHRFGLESLAVEQIREEIESAQRLIGEVTGAQPAGFRAPGYDAGPRVLSVLSELGFRYDGSLLPTRWAPLLRFMAGRIRRQVGGDRAELPGGNEDGPVGSPGQYGPGSGGAFGMAPQYFRASPGGKPVLRLPLAVSPVLRFPLHMSLGMLLGRETVRTGLKRLAARGVPMTYLLHGIDLAAPEELAGYLPERLARGRGFNIALSGREAFLEEVLTSLGARTRIQLTAEYLRETGEAGSESDSVSFLDDSGPQL
jgi:peptidoglycan-N-acetylglucosamine deacetylase